MSLKQIVKWYQRGLFIESDWYLKNCWTRTIYCCYFAVLFWLIVIHKFVIWFQKQTTRFLKNYASGVKKSVRMGLIQDVSSYRNIQLRVRTWENLKIAISSLRYWPLKIVKDVVESDQGLFWNRSLLVKMHVCPQLDEDITLIIQYLK